MYWLFVIKTASSYQYFLNAGFVDTFEEEDFDEYFDKAVNEVDCKWWYL